MESYEEDIDEDMKGILAHYLLNFGNFRPARFRPLVEKFAGHAMTWQVFSGQPKNASRLLGSASTGDIHLSSGPISTAHTISTAL
jgi:hypothetical protein